MRYLVLLVSAASAIALFCMPTTVPAARAATGCSPFALVSVAELTLASLPGYTSVAPAPGPALRPFSLTDYHGSTATTAYVLIPSTWRMDTPPGLHEAEFAVDGGTVGRFDLKAHLLAGSESVNSLASAAQTPPPGASALGTLAPCNLDAVPPGADAGALGATFWLKGGVSGVTFAETVKQGDVSFTLRLELPQPAFSANPDTASRILCSLGIGTLGCGSSGSSSGGGCGSCVAPELLVPISPHYGEPVR